MHKNLMCIYRLVNDDSCCLLKSCKCTDKDNDKNNQRTINSFQRSPDWSEKGN
jgi:hypothetical protein